MRRKNGFTLLELLVVIGIIAILVSLAAVAYSTAQKSTRDSRRKSDLKAVQNALEQYYSASGFAYPATGTCDEILSTTYLENGTRPADPGTDPYTYVCSVTAYCVCAKLERTGGNATNQSATTACSYGAGSFYCVSNLQ